MSKQSQANKKPSLWNKNFILAMAVSFTVASAYGMFNPALPIYADGYGIGSDLIGIIVGIATFLSMFGRAIVGWLSDRKSKKVLVLIALIMMTFSYALYLLPASLAMISAARIIQGIGHGMMITVLSTLAIETLPIERFGEGIGIYSLSGSLAQCVSPLFGTEMAELGQFRMLFIGALVITALSIIILLFINTQPVAPKILLKSSKRAAGKKRHFEFHISEFIYKDALLGAVMLLFTGIIHSAVGNYVAIYGVERGVEGVGMFFTMNSVALLASRPLLGKLADRLHPALLMTPGYAAMALVFILLFFLNSTLLACICGLLYGVGFGLVQSVSQMVSVKSAPPEKRGVANSTFYVLGDIGLSLGAFSAGMLAAWLGYGPMFLVMSGVSVAAAVVFIAGVSTKRQRELLALGKLGTKK